MEYILLLALLLQPEIGNRELFRRSQIRGGKEKIVTDTSSIYDVLHYDISLTLSMPGDSIKDALTKITAVSKSDTLSKINLNFVGLEVDTVQLNGSPCFYERTGTGPNQIISVQPGYSIPEGDTFIVGIGYYGNPLEGIYYSNYNGGLTYVMSIPWDWTDFPIGARYWFPCQDAFYDKAKTDIKITVPSGYEVVASGILTGVEILDEGIMYHFTESYPIPTWYIVFAVSDYAILSDTFTYNGDTMPIFHWVPHPDSGNASVTFSNVPNMLSFFSDLFGERYPFFDEKYGFVKLPYLGWAMENQTNVFWALNLPPNHYYEIIIAHETSHQWWGCSVTPYSINDIWLNEGFATYCEALYSDYWQGGISYYEYMGYIMNYYLSTENTPLGHPYPMYDPPDGAVWTSTTYEKGASLLHMLRHIIGDSAFFTSLQEYYNEYKYNNVVTLQFQSVVEKISGIGLDWFFNEWVYEAGHPEYECIWNWEEMENDSFGVYLIIEQVQKKDWGIPVFKMPVDIAIVAESGDSTFFIIWDSLKIQEFEFQVSEPPCYLLFDPHNWILKRATVTGVEEPPLKEGMELSIYPNPFGTTTAITLSGYHAIGNTSEGKPMTNDQCPMTISIYDLSGRLIRTLNLCNLNKSVQSVLWDGCDNNNKLLPSGVYFCKLSVGDYEESKKLVFLR